MAFNKQKWSEEYYLKNRERILERNKRWNKLNRKKMNEIASKKMARAKSRKNKRVAKEI